MKPTLFYLIIALILMIGLNYNKIFLKNLLSKELSLSENAWKVFTKRWGWFFIFLALLNEFIWRNFSDDLWVKFKVFAIIPIIILFFVSQLPFIKRNKQD